MLYSYSTQQQRLQAGSLNLNSIEYLTQQRDEQAEYQAEIDRLIAEYDRGYKPVEELVSDAVRSSVCVDRWAVTRRFVHQESGLSIPVFCKKYNCTRCGPLRVAAWRRLVELANPERFVTLSWVGYTMVEAARTVQT